VTNRIRTSPTSATIPLRPRPTRACLHTTDHLDKSGPALTYLPNSTIPALPLQTNPRRDKSGPVVSTHLRQIRPCHIKPIPTSQLFPAPVDYPSLARPARLGPATNQYRSGQHPPTFRILPRLFRTCRGNPALLDGPSRPPPRPLDYAQTPHSARQPSAVALSTSTPPSSNGVLFQALIDVYPPPAIQFGLPWK